MFVVIDANLKTGRMQSGRMSSLDYAMKTSSIEYDWANHRIDLQGLNRRTILDLKRRRITSKTVVLKERPTLEMMVRIGYEISEGSSMGELRCHPPPKLGLHQR